ncbi:MAG: polysaccharide pyruvyl transferase [Firmicutes bacterium]|nr:polysaccharide pyruvyl transferase [Bacillota bacterium]
MRILLMGGSLRSGNLGVNALTRGTIELLMSNFSKLDISVLKISNMHSADICVERGNKTIQVQEETCNGKKLVLLMALMVLNKYILGSLFTRFFMHAKLVNLIGKVDYVLDLSEGDSFSDIYGIKRFIIHSVNKYLVLLIKTPLIFLPQTIGPFENRWTKIIASYILAKARHIYVRDELSFNVCCKLLNIKQDKLSLMPDMAFFMKSSCKSKVKPMLPKIKLAHEMVVGFNISGLLWNGGYTPNNMFALQVDYKDVVIEVAEMILNEWSKVRLLFVPHVFAADTAIVEDDRVACRQVQQALNKKYAGRVFCVETAYKENKMKAIIGQCDFFIGSRMHSCIGAIAMNVPTVPIAYSRKFLGVWKMFGIDMWVADLRQQSIEEILAMIFKAINDRHILKQQLEIRLKRVSNERQPIITMLQNK